MTASGPSTSVEDHESTTSVLPIAMSSFKKRWEGLPDNLRAGILAYTIPPPVDLDFLGLNPAKWPKKPFAAHVLMSSPGILNEINAQIFNQTLFKFKSSAPRKGPTIHGSEVALAFLNHIKPAHVGHIRMIACDLDWNNKGSTNMLLQMLAKLATQPLRTIDHMRFEFEAAPAAKRSKRGVVAKTLGFTLRGLVGLKITIFVVGLSRRPDADTFAERLNQWFQRHHKAMSTHVNFLGRLPLEVKLMIYRLLPLEKWQALYRPLMTRPGHMSITTVLGPADNKILPASSLALLLVNGQMSKEILPILYGYGSLTIVASSKWRRSGNAIHDENDGASCIIGRLHGLHEKAKFITTMVIIIKFFCPHSREYNREYTPSIKAIMDKVEECCNFQLADGYRTLPNEEISIISVDSFVRWRRFIIKLPTRRNTELLLEVMTDFSDEAPGTLAYDSQIQIVREGFKRSVNGTSFRLDEFGCMSPV